MELFTLLEQSPALFIAAVFILGLTVGSFLNVVIYRLPVMMEREWQSQAREFLDQPQAEAQEPLTLARPASKITLKDVYRATETQPALRTHTCDKKSPCPVARGMDKMLTEVSGRLESVLEKELKRTTIADLLASYIDRPA